MSYLFEKIPLLGNSTFLIREHTVKWFDYPPHYHPEYELIYISQGQGLRYVGNNVSEFHDGDLVLIGPMTPHYRQNKHLGPVLSKARQILIQFHPDFLGKEFEERNEAKDINHLLRKSVHGIYFFGADAKKAGDYMEIMLKARNNFDGLIIFLTIINILSETKSFELLSHGSIVEYVKKDDDNRIDQVYDFITRNYKEEISLSDLSQKFGMKESAMSHFIKKRTGKNFSDILIDLRLDQACKLLVETELPVSRICFDCGFNNLSNFNRIFKKEKMITPFNFRSTIKQEKRSSSRRP